MQKSEIAEKPVRTPIAVSMDHAVRNKEFNFKGMPVKKHSKKELVSMGALTTGSQNSINVSKKIRLVKFIQDPYKSQEKERFEAATRKNHAVKSSFAVRRHFMFGKGSELQIHLNDYEIEVLGKEESEKKIKELKIQNKQLLEELERRDREVRLDKAVPTFTIQCWTQGRGALIKLFDDTEVNVIKLQTINSRRLGEPIIDVENNNSFEGVMIDSQGLAKEAVVYGTYNEDELSPHTEMYGYSEVESISHVAETINILLNEDIKEISKSAWLASILLQITTAGLDNATATTKITNIVRAVSKAGKIVGVNEEVVPTQLNLEPDLAGLSAIIEKLETIIFKTLQVPQFLVQSESAANRATAVQSATQFLNGVVANDQRWVEDILEEQWYDPYLLARKELIKGIETKEESIDKSQKNELPFHVRRVYNQAKASEFVDLADSVVRLKEARIWDVQKSNEVLGSEEVTQRVMKEIADEQAKFEQNQQAQQDQETETKAKFQNSAIASLQENKTKELSIKERDTKSKEKVAQLLEEIVHATDP